MFVLFVCSGLFIYWTFRVRTLLHGSEEEAEAVLTSDLWTMRRLILAVRAIFQEPMQMA